MLSPLLQKLAFQDIQKSLLSCMNLKLSPVTPEKDLDTRPLYGFFLKLPEAVATLALA